ncbi:MAG: uridine phosphorylase [Pseudonocardiales bacterium]|nr:uridine phosphorylase [Pseudonocardiales bacterium]
MPSPSSAARSGVVDKSEVGMTGVQYHVGVSPGQISNIVLMPGDPFRVQLIADQLDDPVEVAHKREYRTVNGYYKGRLITACSSGMGCPSTAIGVEELARAGATTFIRVGSTAALQPDIAVGDVIVSEGSLRNDGTTAAYVPAGYPAVPDFALTTALADVGRERAAEHGFALHTGINATDDAFYAETPQWIAKLSALGIANVEMESSAMFVVARQRGLRAGMVCAVSGNLISGDVVYGRPNDRLAVGWEHSIAIALEAAHRSAEAL